MFFPSLLFCDKGLFSQSSNAQPSMRSCGGWTRWRLLQRRRGSRTKGKCKKRRREVRRQVRWNKDEMQWLLRLERTTTQQSCPELGSRTWATCTREKLRVWHVKDARDSVLFTPSSRRLQRNSLPVSDHLDKKWLFLPPLPSFLWRPPDWRWWRRRVIPIGPTPTFPLSIQFCLFFKWSLSNL